MTRQPNAPTENRPANIGSSMADQATRLDAFAKVTGRAKYGRDVYPDNGLFAAFVRCPYGAATLEGADQDAARAVEGVVEVEIDGESGRYHGHPVGHVVAESPNALWRGIRALAPRWRREEVATDIETGMEDDGGAPGEDVQTHLDAAAHVLDAVYSTPVQTHSSLETHGCSIDHHGETATVYMSTQGTFAARDGMGEALGLPQSQYEVVCEYVGGGFGSKLNGAGREGMTAGRIAARHNRPVHLFCDRREEHLDTGNRPSLRAHLRIGFNDDGSIVGGEIRTWGGVGVARRGGGARVPSGRYDLGRNIERDHTDVQFNAGAPRAMRAPGHPQGAFVEELMLDEIATRCGIDPLEYRLRLDTSEDRRDMYRYGGELIGWSERADTGSQAGTLRRGFGMGSTSWGSFPSRAEAEVIVNRDGSVQARTGTQDIGTGQRTVMAIVTAERLGIPLDRVSVAIGRSSYPIGPGSGGSTTAWNTAPTMMSAADDAKDKILDAVGQRVGVEASELEIAGGVVRRGDDAVCSWDEACAMIAGDAVTGRGERSNEVMREYGGDGHSEGAQFADVEVDSETGVVRVNRIVAIQACGRVVCRKTAESQVIGGVIQGISYGLFEDKLLDRNTGSMVNPDLEWYRIAGPGDMPLIEPILWRRGQTGVRPLGEPPVIPTAAAIACAVYNAIGHPVRHLPLTPDKVIAAAAGGEGGAA